MPKRQDSLLFGYHSTFTHEQNDMMDAILAPCEKVQSVIVNAMAGTGKTFVSVMGAKLREKPLYYCFAPVEEGTQGFLPGDIIMKSAPYLTPLKQALSKIERDPESCIFDPRLNNHMNQNAWVYAQPHTFERGVNYEDCTVIIDEAQNWTKNQLRKILTRCHDNVKIIIIGHDGQIDLPNPYDSGFKFYRNHFAKVAWSKQIELTKNFRGRFAQYADAI